MRLGFAFDEVFLKHGPDGLPESPARLEAVLAQLEATGLLGDLTRMSFDPADPEELAWLHDPAYVEDLALVSKTGGGYLTADLVASEGTYEAALAAAGAAIGAARKVLSGYLDAAFCAVRPPGHHALRDRGMGFCFFNNAALAAEAARREGAERIAIIDWDVHHGNATQEMFYHRGDVLMVSIHQAYRLGGGGLFYPGTGTVDEVGIDAGMGKNVNVPLPGGALDDDYREAFERVVVPAVELHAPDLIIVSAGYDAHHADPLAEMSLTAPVFHWMAGLVGDLAAQSCEGRVVCCLEGGYDLKALAISVEDTLRALHGLPAAHEDDVAPEVLPAHRAVVREYLDHAIAVHTERLGL